MLKKPILSAFLLLLSSSAFAQTTLVTNDLDQALTEARSQQKHLVLYFFAEDWNAPDDLLKAIPENRLIEKYLSSDFMLVNVDVSSVWGKPISDQYNALKIQPSMALVENNGDMLGYLSLLGAEAQDYIAFFLETDLMHDRRQFIN